MSTSFESLAVLLVLLPGFLASLVYSALQERREASGFRPFMEALACSFVIQAIRPYAPGEGVPLAPVPWNLGPTAKALILAVVLPVTLSYLVEYDLLLRTARVLRMTQRTSRPSTWLDAFAVNREAYAVLYFRDGTRVVGWPYQYSDTPEEGMIYLQEPAWVTEDDQYVAMNAEGFFCCNRSEVLFLTFVKARESA